MAVLADDVRDLSPFKAGAHTPLFRDAIFHLALIGCILVLAILSALSMAVLGWRGAVTALAGYALMTLFIMLGLVRHAHPSRFGLANTITLTRAGLTALLFGFAGEWFFGGLPAFSPGLRWALAGVASLILVLDGLDGRVARRNGMASPFGARFDMEADTLFMLAVYVLAVAGSAVDAWIMACGSVRYAFVVTGLFITRLNAPFRPTLRGKAIYVAQAAAPIIALMPICPSFLACLLCAAAFLLVLYSFAVDSLWLLRHAPESGGQEEAFG